MRRLSALAWRTVRARRLRSVLTIAGIALGVGVLFAALATNAAIDASVRQTVAEMLGRTDIRVAAFEEQGLTAPTVAAISGTRGVATAAPELERRTYLASGTVQAGALPAPVTVLGIDPGLDGRLHDLTLAGGTQLVGGVGGNALVSETLAHDEHLALGGQVTVNGAAAVGPTAYRIVGLLAGDGPLPDAEGRLVVLTLGDAAKLFAADGVTRVDVGVAAGSDVATVTAALEATITREPYVLSGPADIEASLRTSAADFQATIALVAAVALFVGAFLIFNTLSMTIAERLRDVGLLRAAGTTSGQVNRLVLFQALLLGGVGSIAGILGGTVLAALIAAYLASTHAVPLAGLDVTPDAIGLALALGLLVTLAAALEPAWRAGRISPVEALRADVVHATSVGARLRWLVVVFIAIAATGFVLWPRPATLGETGTGTSLGDLLSVSSVRPLVIYGLLLLAALASSVVTGPLGRLVGLPVALLFRTEERLARSSLVRDRSRTALTVGALTIGLAMIVAVGTAAQASNQSASAWLSDVVPGSELVTSIRPIASSEPPLHDLAAVPGVARVSPIATFGLDLAGTRVDGAAISGADYAADGRLTFVAGDRASALRKLDAGGTAIVPQSVADRLDVHVGDRLTFATGSGATTLAVTAIVARSLPGLTGESIIVGWPDALAHFGATGAEAFAIRYEPGRQAAAQPALDQVARSEALQPAGLGAIQGAIGDAVSRVLDLFNALAVVAVLAAGLGIVNTLSMSVMERVREIGILRATGMTRRQVSRMVVVEAGMLGVVGAILGCVTGVVVGLTLLVAAGGRTTVPIEPPWISIVLAAAFGIVTSVVAAIYPSRLAGRISVVRAVQFE